MLGQPSCLRAPRTAELALPGARGLPGESGGSGERRGGPVGAARRPRGSLSCGDPAWGLRVVVSPVAGLGV